MKTVRFCFKTLRYRSSCLGVFLEKGVLKLCSKLTGEHPCRSAISIKLLRNFIVIALRHGCSPANLLYIFSAPFPKNISGRLLVKITKTFNSNFELITDSLGLFDWISQLNISNDKVQNVS